MGGRGGGGRPARNQSAETDAFIKAVNEDKSISDITRRELLSGAKKSLSTFQNDESVQARERIKELGQKIGGLGPLPSPEKVRLENELRSLESQVGTRQSQKSAFDTSSAGLRKDFDAAREGQAPKFRFRQALEKKRELLQDRPGQRQLILSKGPR